MRSTRYTSRPVLIALAVFLLLSFSTDAFAQRGALRIGPDLGYASAPDSPSLSFDGTVITVEAWIKHDGQSDPDALIIDKQDADDYGYELRFVGSGEEVPVIFDAGFSLNNITSISGIPAGVWTHVAVVYDGNQAAIYIDGELDNSRSASDDFNDRDVPLHFGSNEAGNSGFFSGEIDEVRLWETAFSLIEVRELMHGKIDGKSGLRAHFSFDGESSSTLSDAAGANALTLAGDAGVVTPGIFPIPPHLYVRPGNTQVDLTWDERDTEEAAAFRIYRSTVPDGADRTEIATIAGGTHSYTDGDGLSNGVTYYYEVTAVDAEGQESDYSKPANTSPYSVLGGGHLSLSGAGYGELSHRPSLTIDGEVITVEAWVKHDGQSDPDALIIDKQNADDYGYELRFVGSGEEVPVIFDAGFSLANITSVSGIPADVWTHIAVVYDGDQAAIYINGVLDNSVSTNDDFNDRGVPLHIGSNEAGNSGFFSGAIDEVRIWNVARTAAQVQAGRFELLTGNEDGLAGYWRFDETGRAAASGMSFRHGSVELVGDAAIEVGGSAPQPAYVYAEPGDGQVALSWSPRDANDAAAYTIFRSTVSSGADRTEIATVDPNSMSFVDTDVSDDVTYFYEVNVINPEGQTSDYPHMAAATSSVLRSGNALALDGAGDFATVEDRPSLSMSGTVITVEAWFKHDGQGGENAAILDKQNADDYGYELRLDGTGTDRTLTFDAGFSVANISSTEPIPADTWTHVAVVYDGNQATMYLNGEVDNQRSATDDFGDRDAPLRIGANEAGNAQFFSGLIDEVRIWTVARTEAEIRNSYTRTLRGDEAGLVGYWRFDQQAESQSPLVAYGSIERPLTATLSGDATFTTSGAFTGSDEGTSVEPLGDDLPDAFALEGNYPNPVRQATTIRYGLPRTAEVTLTVYDLLGRAVATPVEASQQPGGWYEIPFEAANLPSGVYIYRLEAGDHVSTRKMMVVR